MKSLLTLFIVTFCLWMQLPAIAADGDSRVPGELLVRLQDGVSPQTFVRDWNGNRRASTELTYARPVGRRFNIHLLRYDPTRPDAEDLLARVRAHPLVVSTQFNYEVQFRVFPNDPDVDRQWGLVKIGADQVWEITTGGQTTRGDKIVVAVLDNGFDIHHEDLRDNVWHNAGEIPGDGIDNDGNGYVDDVDGWNFIDSSATHRVDQHGNSVAGLVGAKGNNGIGVTGINWDVQLMLLDIRLVDQIVAAYEYVLEQRDLYNKTQGRQGAFIVATNASFGQNRTFCTDQPVWGAMYDLLGEVGVLTGAGTANSAWDVEEVGDMPTTCTSDYLLTVLNTTETDQRYQGSAYGTVSIDMGAPGQDSYTTKPDNEYGVFNGNSASAPHLTGAIALLYSLPCDAIAESALAQPAQTARQIRDLILEGVDLVAGLEKYTATGGRLNVFNSLQLAQALCKGTTGPLQIKNLFPNPASEQVTLEFETPDFDPYELRVFNALGQEVLRRDVTPTRFSVKRELIPVNQLTPGVYVLVLQRGKNRETIKFVIAH